MKEIIDLHVFMMVFLNWSEITTETGVSTLFRDTTKCVLFNPKGTTPMNCRSGVYRVVWFLEKVLYW